MVENDTPIPLNGKPFDKLVMLHRPPRSIKLGRTKLTVIGPGKAHLETLREEWRDWLATMNPEAPARTRRSDRSSRRPRSSSGRIPRT